MPAPVTETEQLVRRNIATGDIFVLAHARAQMKRRGIALDAVLAGVPGGEVIEHYPHDDEGPAVLMLQWDRDKPQPKPLHVVWRIEAATAGPVLLVTVYAPDPAQWSDDFRRRRSAAV